MAGYRTTDGSALASIVAVEAGAEKPYILAKMVDIPKGCKKAGMASEYVAIIVTGGSQVCPF